jgi:DNA-binding response OmpR family regulator
MMGASMNDLSSTRVLHIDAPPPFLRFVEKFCQSKGLTTDSTDSEALGFHYALVRRYKVILLGAHAPRIDAGRILKGLARARIATPIFLLTETPGKDAKWMALHPNVMGLLPKPLDVRELSRCLQYADKPPELDPEEREKILAVLGRWEKSMKHGG